MKVIACLICTMDQVPIPTNGRGLKEIQQDMTSRLLLIKLIKGDTFEIVDVIGGPGDPADMIVNFKGYVGNTRHNTGEDRGYVINTARDLWKRYSLNKNGIAYRVIDSYLQ